MAFSEIAPGVVPVSLELPESVRGEVRAYELHEPVAGHQPSQYGMLSISPPTSRRDAGTHPLN